MKDLWRSLHLYQPIILSVVILLGSILGITLVVVPVARTTFELAAATRSLSTEIGQLRAKNSLLDGLDEETLRGQLEAIVTAVPPDKALPSLLLTVEGLSGQSGITLSDLTLSPGIIATGAAQESTVTEKQLGANLLSFAVTVEGTFDGLRSFLNSVVGVRRLMRVRNFTATFASSGTTKTLLQMDTFYIPYPTSLGRPTQKLNPLSVREEELLVRIAAMPN